MRPQPHLRFALPTLLLAAFVLALPGRAIGGVEEPSRFIFFSVLDGLYEDGVANEDLERILMENEKGFHIHFVYACPVCMPTVWALEAYQSRPDRLHSVKSGASTFGPGLGKEVREQLHSEDSNTRLAAIYTLVGGWIERRMKKLRLTEAEQALLRKDLEEKREEGMAMLASFRHKGAVELYAQAYSGDPELECAVCNGAVGKPMGSGGEK